jgi:hypothetical protein
MKRITMYVLLALGIGIPTAALAARAVSASHASCPLGCHNCPFGK